MHLGVSCLLTRVKSDFIAVEPKSTFTAAFPRSRAKNCRICAKNSSAPWERQRTRIRMSYPAHISINRNSSSPSCVAFLRVVLLIRLEEEHNLNPTEVSANCVSIIVLDRYRIASGQSWGGGLGSGAPFWSEDECRAKIPFLPSHRSQLGIWSNHKIPNERESDEIPVWKQGRRELEPGAPSVTISRKLEASFRSLSIIEHATRVFSGVGQALLHFIWSLFGLSDQGRHEE